MKRLLSYRAGLLAGAATVLVSAGSAYAQGLALEEIVVTARKQEERLQDVPLTVTAFTGSMIDQHDITDPYDLSRLAPGFNFQNNAGRRSNSRLLMRGLTTSTTGTAKASAFIDGVYVFGDFSFIDFGNVERIEIMPGPQSTQFGRSTFAGAFNFVTKLPTEEVQGRAQAAIGTLGTSELSARIGGPLVGDKLLGQLAVYHTQIKGPDTWKNIDGTRIASSKSQSIYPTLVFNPSDEVQLILRSSYNKDDDGPGQAYAVDGSERNALFTKPDGTTARYITGPLRDPNYGVEGSPYQFNLEPLTNPGLRHYNWRNNAELGWTIGEHQLKILGAHNYEQEFSQQDGDFTFFAGTNSFNKAVREDDSVEVRLTSPQDQALRYSGGVFYLKTQNRAAGRTLQRNTISATGVVTAVNANILTGSVSTVKDRSVFGAVYFDVTDDLTVTAEGRYQSEKVISLNLLPAAGARALFQETYKTFLPRINVDYKVTDDVMLYGVFSKGNQPGGFNTSPFIGQGGTTAADAFIDEEEVNNYELGIKSTWFDGSVLFNLSAFHMDWSKQQVSRNFLSNTGVVFSVTQNAGSSNINGIETEAQWQVSKEFDIRFTGSFYDTEYGSTVCSPNLANLVGRSDLPAPNFCLFVGGNHFEAVPRYQTSLSFGYETEIANDWMGFFRGEWGYQSKQYDSEMNLNWARASNVISGRVGIENETVSFELWARNLTNEKAYPRVGRFNDIRISPSAATNQTNVVTPRLPRQVGVRATFNY